MDEFYRELEEDMQRERLRAFWNQYGAWIMGACAALVFGTALGSGWHYYKRSQGMKATAKLEQALSEIGKTPPVTATLDQLQQSSAHDIAAIAELHYAGKQLRDKNYDAAIQTYKAIAADKNTDKGLKALANSLSLYTTVENGPAAGTPDAEKDAPFYALYAETQAWQAVQNNNIAEAQKRFASLRDTPGIPAGVQERAGLMANYFSDAAK